MTISVGLLRPPVNPEDLVVEVVREEPLIVLLPVSHPLTARVDGDLSDLRDEDFISDPSSPPSSCSSLTLTGACRQVGFTPRIHQEVSETASVVALVAAGGVALAPASVRHLRIPGVTHRPIARPGHDLPSHSFAINTAWLALQMIATDLLAWLRHLCLSGDLATAEPRRLRYTLLHTAGILARSARRTRLRLAANWPWTPELISAFARLPGWAPG